MYSRGWYATRKLHCIALFWTIIWVHQSALEHREKRFLFGQHGLCLWDYWRAIVSSPRGVRDGREKMLTRCVAEDRPGRVTYSLYKSTSSKDLFKKRNNTSLHRQLLVVLLLQTSPVASRTYPFPSVKYILHST